MGIRLPRDLVARVDELAAAEGTSRAGILQEILREIVPKIETVQRRVVIRLRKAE